ncbi:MAG: hypothetical protein ITF99_08385 [Chryseobacterium sp.]|nr:hypothetical protein [Chryseobacterium sp.]
MKTKIYLFPNYCKIIGAGIFISAILLFIIQTQTQILSFDDEYEIVKILLLGGLFLFNFSKEKIEDERLIRIRLMAWAYSFYIVAFTVVAGRIFNFFLDEDLQFYNSATALLITYLSANIVIFIRYRELDVVE